MNLRPLTIGLVAAPLLLTWAPAHADLESPYAGNPVQGGTITLDAICLGEEGLGGQPSETWSIQWFPAGVTTGTPNGSVSGPTTYDPVTDVVTGSLVIPADAPLGDTYVARWNCLQYANGDEGTYAPESVFTIGVAGPTTTIEPTVTTVGPGPVVTEPAPTPGVTPVLPSTGSTSRPVWMLGALAITAGVMVRRAVRRAA